MLVGSRHVAFTNFHRLVAEVRPEIDAALARVFDSGVFVLGEEGLAFERELASVCGVEHAIGVASGTDAIEIALRALDIGPGDEVITQANTCVPTVAAIVRAGASPVLCDVNSVTGTMSPESLASAVSPKSRGVIPVHLYGQCADMQGISEVARAHALRIVEDSAQALGALGSGRAAGGHGAFGAFSFYPTKNLGALGDAGAIVCSDFDLAVRVRRLRQYGQIGTGECVLRGVNSRLDELQAAILRARLPGLRANNDRRRRIAAEYDAALAGTAAAPLGRLSDSVHVFHLYVVRTGRRDVFVDELHRRGVETRIHYPLPVHGHPAFRSLGGRSVSLQNAERLSREVVSLPLYPELTDAEVEYVANAARAAANLN